MENRKYKIGDYVKISTSSVAPIAVITGYSEKDDEHTSRPNEKFWYEVCFANEWYSRKSTAESILKPATETEYLKCKIKAVNSYVNEIEYCLSCIKKLQKSA